MLLPKRVKYRRVQRGRMTGKATRGNVVCQGQYGLVALEPAWISSTQIEAARVAMTSSLPRIQGIRKGFSDAQVLPSAADLPAATGAPGVPTNKIGGRLAKIKKIPWAAKSLLHLRKPEDRAHWEAPQLNLTAEEARWYTLARVDSATVSTAGGTGVAFRKRDKELAKTLLDEQKRLRAEIKDRWAELKRTYREARPELTSHENWKKIFDEQ